MFFIMKLKRGLIFTPLYQIEFNYLNFQAKK